MVFITTADSNRIILMRPGSGVNISAMGNICLWFTLNLISLLSACMLPTALSDSLNTNVPKVTIIYLLSAWDREITATPHAHKHTATTSTHTLVYQH